MEDLSLHILDVAENSTAAGASLVEILIYVNRAEDVLTLAVRDNGRGMNEEMAKSVSDPFVTTRTTRRVGMGIPLLAQAAEEAGGNLVVRSKIGEGTELSASFKYSHIDRKPLGDIGATLVSLILGNPEIDFRYEADIDGEKTEIDTREIKKELEGVSITEPAVLELIRETAKNC